MLPKHGDLFLIGSPRVFGIVVNGDPGSFQNLGNILKVGMMDDAVQCVKADASFSQVFMTVFGRAAGIFTVIDMEDGDLVFPKNLVKPCKDTLGKIGRAHV